MNFAAIQKYDHLRWHYQDNKRKEYGPVCTQQMLDYLKCDSIESRTYVKNQYLPYWHRLENTVLGEEYAKKILEEKKAYQNKTVVILNDLHSVTDAESRANTTSNIIRRDQINRMTGIEFEDFVFDVYTRKGYSVKKTPVSGDNGVDLIMSHQNKKIAVQCKRTIANVGNAAIQEVFSGRAFYNCDEAWVVITSSYTSPAKTLAEKLKVRLIEVGEIL